MARIPAHTAVSKTEGIFRRQQRKSRNQSLPEAEFISVVNTWLTRLQRRNFPASTLGILDSAGIFRRVFQTQKVDPAQAGTDPTIFCLLIPCSTTAPPFEAM